MYSYKVCIYEIFFYYRLQVAYDHCRNAVLFVMSISICE